MTISNNTKIDASFKFAHGKAYTTTQKGLENEDAGSGFILGASSIFAQDGAIPTTAPGVDTALLTYYGTGADPRFRMIKDVSSPLNQSWYSSTDGTTLTTMRATRIGNWIPPTFGNYTIRIFLTKTTSTTVAYLQEIFFSDSTSPLFDYKTGILTFESDPLAAYAGIAGGPPDGIQISGYVYAGTLLSQIFDSNGNFSGGLSDLVVSGVGTSQARFSTSTKSLAVTAPNAIGTTWIDELTSLSTTPEWRNTTVLPNGKIIVIGGDSGNTVPYIAYSYGDGKWFLSSFPNVTVKKLNSIWAADSLTIYATDLNTSTGLLRSIDGGLNWTQLSNPSTATEASIWGTSTTNIYIVSATGVIKHSSNGTTFSAETNSDSHDLHGVWGSSTTDIFAVGDNGTIRHSTGTGTWSGQTSGVATTLRAVFGLSSTSVYAVGNSGTVIHYNGSAWSAQTGLPSTFTARSIWGTVTGTGTRLYISGIDSGPVGAIYFSNGDGTWAVQHSSATQLYGVFGSTKNGVYAAGVSGDIKALHQNPAIDVTGNIALDGYIHASYANYDHSISFDGYTVNLSAGALSDQVLKYDGVSFNAQYEKTSAIFGPGSDGAVHLDGATNFNNFSSRSGSIYTLTRSCFITDLTHDSGVTLKTAGFIIHAKSYTPVSGAIIDHSGGNGTAPTGGAAAAAGSIGGGAAGPNGRAGIGVGTVGTGTNNSLGGTGGNSGFSSSPQVGGTATQLTVTQGSPSYAPFAAIGHVTGAGAIVMITGGGSGGSGSGTQVASSGGGGGGGGGVTILNIGTFDLTNADAGFIRCKGGVGGDAGVSGDGGGGGGGGGGVVICVYNRLLGIGVHSFSFYCNVTGGAGGANTTFASASTSGAAGTVLAVPATQ